MAIARCGGKVSILAVFGGVLESTEYQLPPDCKLGCSGVSKAAFTKVVGGVNCFVLVSAIRSNTARHISTSGALLTTSSTKGIANLMSKSLEPTLDPRLNRSA